MSECEIDLTGDWDPSAARRTGQSYNGWLVDALDGVARSRPFARSANQTRLASVESLLDLSLKPCECRTRPSSRAKPSPVDRAHPWSAGPKMEGVNDMVTERDIVEELMVDVLERGYDELGKCRTDGRRRRWLKRKVVKNDIVIGFWPDEVD